LWTRSLLRQGSCRYASISTYTIGMSIYIINLKIAQLLYEIREAVRNFIVGILYADFFCIYVNQV